MKLDVQSGAIDIAWRSMTPTDIDSLRSASGVKVQTGPGGELRYIVFNFKTMPGSNDAQKRAVRRAIAYSVDRQALSDKVYKGTFKPAYSWCPTVCNTTSTRSRTSSGRLRTRRRRPTS